MIRNNSSKDELEKAVRNPIKTGSVHPELVEGFIDVLVNGSTGSP